MQLDKQERAVAVQIVSDYFNETISVVKDYQFAAQMGTDSATAAHLDRLIASRTRLLLDGLDNHPDLSGRVIRFLNWNQRNHLFAAAKIVDPTMAVDPSMVIYLGGANLAGTNLTGANLTGANLECAKLDSSKLFRVDFTSAIMTRAKLVSADLSQANLVGAKTRRI